MRKTIYLLCLLAFQVVFSQVEINSESELKANFFETNIDENRFSVDKKLKYTLPNNIDFKFEDIKNNSEKKFTIVNTNQTYFVVGTPANAKPILYQNKINRDTNLSENIDTNAKKEFVEKIIRKKIKEEIQKYLLINEALTYGDRNIELYKNYTDLENKLIIVKPINSQIELQIGNNIYPFLNKLYKTELDKTQLNSLNLLAINF